MNTEKFFFVQKNADRGLRPRCASVSKANNPRRPLLLAFSLADEARARWRVCANQQLRTSNSFNTNLLSVFISSSLLWWDLCLQQSADAYTQRRVFEFFVFCCERTKQRQNCVEAVLASFLNFPSSLSLKSEIRRIGFKEKQSSSRARTEAKFNLQLCIATAASAGCAFVRGCKQ